MEEENFMKATQNDLDREYAKVSKSRQAIREELQQLIEDVEELVRRIGDAADPELERLRSKVQSTVASARQAIESRSESPRQRVREVVSAGTAYVYDQPWQVVGIAGLLGIAVGFLVARR
jgi:ElaB/YqjD/DUF883 family membrane-anchored ribosome-binding protein